MPEPGQFYSNEEYYAALFHEMGHSTGHQARLNREGITNHGSFGDHLYSLEELVAEFTSCFLCTDLGILDPRENSAAYLDNWSRQLKDKRRMLIEAASKAKKAVVYINKGKEKDNDKQSESLLGQRQEG